MFDCGDVRGADPDLLVVGWQSAGGFERAEATAIGQATGTPWILWIAVPWFLLVASVVLRAYFEGDKQAELERELARLKHG